MVRPCLLHALKAVRRRAIPARALAPEIEPFELVEAVHALVVDSPAFPPEQRVDAPVAVADPRERDLPDTSDQRVVIARTRRVVEGRSGQHNHAARTASGDTVRVDEIPCKHAPLRWPHSFFLMTSCAEISALQHKLVEGEIRDKLLQLPVLRFELLEATELGGAEPSVFLPPIIEGGFADTHLAAHLRDLRSGLGLTEGVDDLRLGKLGCLHGDLGLCSGKIGSPSLYFSVVPFYGRRSTLSAMDGYQGSGSDRGWAKYHRRCGELCLELGRKEEALKRFNQALDLNPKVGVKRKRNALQKGLRAG